MGDYHRLGSGPGEGWGWLDELVRDANEGDPGALERLREYLDENPDLTRRLGDMGVHAEYAWRERVAQGNSLLAEAVRLEMDRMRRDLLGDRADPLERLMAQAVVLTHLELAHRHARAASSPAPRAGQATTEQKRLDGAQRRFIEAAKALEAVRKLVSERGGTRTKTLKVATTG
ncbi:MAG: hypothetical protein U0835_23120 [Isosphaeraceae bacterium]